MDIRFLNEEHRKRFTDYCQKARVHPEDRERKALFFILAGSNDLVSKGINRMYDFSENMVKFHPDHLEEDLQPFAFCSSSYALVRLALNLYNSGYKSLPVAETFFDLDEDNKTLVIEALKLRFKIK